MIVTWRTRLHHRFRIPRNAIHNSLMLGLAAWVVLFVALSWGLPQ